MSKNVLFVCESCQFASGNKENCSAGKQLLNQLRTQHETEIKSSELEIQGVGCLCTCERPCVIAIAGVNKPTYLFVDLPINGAPEALIELGELYANSENGMIPRYQLPNILKSSRLARIPPWPLQN